MVFNELVTYIDKKELKHESVKPDAVQSYRDKYEVINVEGWRIDVESVLVKHLTRLQFAKLNAKGMRKVLKISRNSMGDADLLKHLKTELKDKSRYPSSVNQMCITFFETRKAKFPACYKYFRGRGH